MSSDFPILTISTQPIELCKLLKIANMVSGGGEAKIVISEGYVYLNGEPEFQKRKKIYADDIVEFNGEIIQVAFEAKAPEPVKIKSTSPIKQQTKKIKNSNNKQNKKAKNQPEPSEFEMIKTNKRKPISF